MSSYLPVQHAPKTLIHVKDLHKSFNGNHVLRGISLDVHEKEVMCIIGISGCGKSTLLRCISGLETSDAGEIHLEDDNFTMVFQYSALFDSLSVYENVGFSLLEEPDESTGTTRRFQNLPEAEVRRIVEEKLRLVGLDGIEDKFPNELSGGMQKRVSFARAIVSDPKIILYDEPTAGLDPIASTVIEDYILKLRDELEAASVVVTHQHSTIHRAADRICLLHEGRVQWIGTPQELERTDNPYARQFANASLEGPLTD
ncbi:MAG: ATP-binding cassette domain-containing protein [Vampirovibrio sp.]|nr:ATP-binding cassette domain-containing protein [Vampirovibrio sp.]